MRLSPDPMTDRWLNMQRYGSAYPLVEARRTAGLIARIFGWWLFITGLGLALIAVT